MVDGTNVGTNVGLNEGKMLAYSTDLVIIGGSVTEARAMSGKFNTFACFCNSNVKLPDTIDELSNSTTFPL